MNEQKKQYKDYGAGWEKQSSYGSLISVCLDVELLKEFIEQAKNGKIWITLGTNSKKQEGSKQPDFRVLAPRLPQAFNAYNEPLPTMPKKRWEPPAITQHQEIQNMAKDKCESHIVNTFTEEDVPF